MKIVQENKVADDQVAVLHFEGNAQTADMPYVHQVLEDTYQSGKTYLILVMDQVAELSSAFVGELVSAKRKLLERHGNMAIVGLPYSAREKLAMVGMEYTFQCYPDTLTAFNHYRWDYNRKPQTVSLKLPSRLQTVPAVRRFISGVAKQKGYSFKDSFRIEAIVDEIANNAIEHGDPDQEHIETELIIDKKRIEILIRNRTHAEKVTRLREVLAATQDVANGSSYRGRGIPLVRLLSDSLDVDIDKNGTTVKIVKMREET